MSERRCMGCMKMHDLARVCPYCGFDEVMYVPAPHQLPLETLLDGKYLVGKVLGEGGFGITYLGYDVVHDVKLAIREYYPTGFVTRAATLSNTVRPYEIEQRTVLEKGRDQFIKEARNLSRFRDRPEVVTVKDFFYQNDTAYVVMTYTEGQTLLQYLETMGGKLPAAQVFEMKIGRAHV